MKPHLLTFLAMWPCLLQGCTRDPMTVKADFKKSLDDIGGWSEISWMAPHKSVVSEVVAKANDCWFTVCKFESGNFGLEVYSSDPTRLDEYDLRTRLYSEIIGPNANTIMVTYPSEKHLWCKLSTVQCERAIEILTAFRRSI